MSKVSENREEREYEVEKIIDSKRIRGKMYYLLRWKGCSARHDTWEPQNMLSCPELIKKYKEEKKKSTVKSPQNATKKKVNKKGKKTKTVRDKKNVDENAEYKVDKIIDSRRIRGKMYYLVRMKGFSARDDTWEHENMLSCPELIKKYKKEVEKIIDSKRIRGKMYYLLRWKGCSARDDTWEPQNMLSCPELIKKYKEEVSTSIIFYE